MTDTGEGPPRVPEDSVIYSIEDFCFWRREGGIWVRQESEASTFEDLHGKIADATPERRDPMIRRFTTSDGREGVQFSDGTVATREPHRNDGFGWWVAISIDALLENQPGVQITWIDGEAETR